MQHLLNAGFPAVALAAAGTCRTAIPGVPNRVPDLAFLDCVSDNAANNLTVEVGSREYTTTAAAASGQANIVLDDVTGLADGNVLLIFGADGAAAIHPVIASSGINSTTRTVTLTANLAAALPAGSKVYLMRTHSTLTVGAAALRLGPVPFPGAILRGEKGMPMRLNLPVSSAGRIGAASAYMI